MIYQSALPRILRIGPRASSDLGAVLTALGYCRPLVITDSFMNESGRLQALLHGLAADGISAQAFWDTVPEPTLSSIDRALEALKAADADCVVGFGGGSPIDSAKAVAVLAAHGGDLRRFKAPALTDAPGLPIIALPTTAGTGSEATHFTIITDDASDEKMLCAGLAFLPVAALVDYELTLSMPPRLTADTGIDALTHAIEAYVSRRANPFSDGFALSAMQAIAPNLRRAYAQPQNRPAREAMMFGATLAGIAFSNSSVALVHGMSRPIGAHFHVAHGLSNAMLLPTVTAWSASAAPARYADCARAMGIATRDDNDDGAVEKLIAELRALNADLAVPTPAAHGIAPERWEALLPVMAEQAVASGSPANNPLVPSAEEIIALYRQVWAA